MGRAMSRSAGAASSSGRAAAGNSAGAASNSAAGSSGGAVMFNIPAGLSRVVRADGRVVRADGRTLRSLLLSSAARRSVPLMTAVKIALEDSEGVAPDAPASDRAPSRCFCQGGEVDPAGCVQAGHIACLDEAVALVGWPDSRPQYHLYEDSTSWDWEVGRPMEWPDYDNPTLIAAKNGDLAMLKHLENKYGATTLLDTGPFSALRAALRSGSLPLVTELCTPPPDNRYDRKKWLIFINDRLIPDCAIARMCEILPADPDMRPQLSLVRPAICGSYRPVLEGHGYVDRADLNMDNVRRYSAVWKECPGLDTWWSTHDVSAFSCTRDRALAIFDRSMDLLRDAKWGDRCRRHVAEKLWATTTAGPTADFAHVAAFVECGFASDPELRHIVVHNYWTFYDGMGIPTLVIANLLSDERYRELCGVERNKSLAT